MPKITYLKNMHVETPEDIFDKLEQLSFVFSASFSGNCLTAEFSDIKDYIDEEPEDCDINGFLSGFLSEVISKSRGKIGDVIFNKKEEE